MPAVAAMAPRVKVMVKMMEKRSEGKKTLHYAPVAGRLSVVVKSKAHQSSMGEGGMRGSRDGRKTSTRNRIAIYDGWKREEGIVIRVLG